MDIVDLINRHGLNPARSADDITLEITVSSTANHSDMGITITVDQGQPQIISGIQGTHHVQFALADTAADHQLRIELWGKTWQHTQQDAGGVIIRDDVVTVDRVLIAGTDITAVMLERGIYYHNFNGNARVNYQVPWHGMMGCNGTMDFDFRTPYYDWLLETI